MLKLLLTTTKSWIYLTINIYSTKTTQDTPLLQYLFDNVRPKPTYHRDWVAVKTIPKTIQHQTKSYYINGGKDFILGKWKMLTFQILSIDDIKPFTGDTYQKLLKNVDIFLKTLELNSWE